MATKRDRWASSSEDDEDKKDRQRAARTKKSKQKTNTKLGKSGAVDESSSAPNVPLADADAHGQVHNPLLHGCRSVYDTYERLDRVSEGTYGIVWKAKDMTTGEIRALKQIKFHYGEESISASNLQWKEGFPVTALREISVLLALSHESIVSVQEMVVGDTPDKVFMVMEFFDCDLKDALSRASSAGPLAQSELKGILQQIPAGTAHMHGRKFLHRDLKPSNILVQLTSGRIALADFGLARRHAPGAAMTLPVVTLWYRAPELLFGQSQYGLEIDMWSIGCIMGELIRSGGRLKGGDDEDDSNAIMKGQGEIDQIDAIFTMMGVPDETSWPGFATLPNTKLIRWGASSERQFEKIFRIASLGTSSQSTFLDKNGFALLERMLSLDPDRRITAQDAVDHKYFTEGVAPRIPEYFIEFAEKNPGSTT